MCPRIVIPGNGTSVRDSRSAPPSRAFASYSATALRGLARPELPVNASKRRPLNFGEDEF